MTTNILANKKIILNKYFIADVVIFLSIAPIALLLRLDGNIQAVVAENLLAICFITIVFTSIKIATIKAFGLYRRVWLYAGVNEVKDLLFAIAVSACIEIAVFKLLRNLPMLAWLALQSLPRSLPLLDSLLSLIAIVGFRYGMRAFLQSQRKRSEQGFPNTSKRILVVGAGDAGTSLVRQMQLEINQAMQPIAFIDNDPKKLHQNILGLNVVGDRSAIVSACKSLQIDKVIIAMPSASGENIREVVTICKKNNISVSTLPSLNEILRESTGVQINTLREVQIEDLLRRSPIRTDLKKVYELVHGKRVLITGAGGSIGSEICRQIVKFQPAEIILLGKGENSIFTIQQELEKTILAMKSKTLDVKLPRLHAFICDIRSMPRLDLAFDRFRPEIVFHAAAHKHVPLMELNAPEAITTNVLGTKNLTDLALHYEVENFVMISTDKSVNPTNVMGATKRVAEMVVLQSAKYSKRSFTVVRFGNVLGSRGSVVPTFKRQIAEGGPITITHPDITRYFMTIPEAVQLVLQSAVLGRSGEVCMLDMGEPVKILDLAKDLIQLSGYKAGKDIDIVYTGLRPGEKLFEELFIPGEQYERTEHEKIRIVRNASERLPSMLNATVEKLGKAAEANDSYEICTLLQTIVLGYTSSLFLGANSQTMPSNLSSNNSLITSTLERLYNNNGNTSIVKSHFTAEEFQSALEDRQFRLHYQPIVDLDTRKTIGFESFIRWQHPERGAIAPIEFLDDLERLGAIVPVGWWAIDEVCQQLKAWEQQFPHKPIEISVNLSQQQFFHPDLVTQVTACIQVNAIQPGSLVLEVPERIVKQDPNKVVAVLSALKAIEVKVALDRVGTDSDFTNSLENINKLYAHFDSLKLHSTMLEDITGNDEFLRSVARLADNLDIDLIAVGVETLKQSNRLLNMNFKYGQGYLFSRPVGK